MRSLLLPFTLSLACLFLLQGCDTSEPNSNTKHSSVRVGTRLTFERVNRLTTKRDTVIMTITDIGAAYSGKTNVTRARTSDTLLSEDGLLLNLESNGEYSIYSGNWALMPIVTKQGYDLGIDTVDFGGGQVGVFHNVVKYLGSSSVTIEDVTYPIEQTAVDFFDTTFSTQGEVINIDESRMTLSFSRDLNFITGMDITSGGTTLADAPMTLIKIED